MGGLLLRLSFPQNRLPAGKDFFVCVKRLLWKQVQETGI